MFRVRATTRKSTKRAVSPFKHVSDSGVQAVTGLEHTLAHLLDAETTATLTTKPWLRLERGLRIQKLRAFTDAYPGLSLPEKDTLLTFLIWANDAKQLNTKSQITYDDGQIQSIKGLKVIRSGDPSAPPIYKIDTGRQTKRVSSHILVPSEKGKSSEE